MTMQKEIAAQQKKAAAEKKKQKAETTKLCNKTLGKLAPIFAAYTKVLQHPSYAKLPKYISDNVKKSHEVCELLRTEASRSVGTEGKASFDLTQVETAFKDADKTMKDAMEILAAFAKF